MQVHQTRRRFQAIADDSAGKNGRGDFGLDPQTVEGRAQLAAVVAAWEMSKNYAAEESKRRAEAQVLGQRRTLQIHERQAMIKAVQTVYGKINEGETPSAEYLAAKAEECEPNEPRASSLGRWIRSAASETTRWNPCNLLWILTVILGSRAQFRSWKCHIIPRLTGE